MDSQIHAVRTNRCFELLQVWLSIWHDRVKAWRHLSQLPRPNKKSRISSASLKPSGEAYESLGRVCKFIEHVSILIGHSEDDAIIDRQLAKALFWHDFDIWLSYIEFIQFAKEEANDWHIPAINECRSRFASINDEKP